MQQYLSSVWESIVDGVVDIRSHMSRTLLQAVGIILGVGSVVATFGLIDGGKHQMEKFWNETGGVRKMMVRNADVVNAVQNAQEKKSVGLTLGDAEKLRRESTTLELVEPTMERDERVRASGFEKRLEVSGSTPAYEPMYDFHPAEGRFLTAEDVAASSKVVVLGSTRREQLFGGRPALGQTVMIADSSYVVVGVMERKEFSFNAANDNALEWMNRMVFIPITTMVNRMSGDRAEQKVAFINVQVREMGLMDKATEEVTAIVKRAHEGVKDFEVYNRADRMREAQQQGRIYDITFLVCGTISLLVGGIVIMNILLASFNERVREVGTRKALGATGLNIMAQFIVESVVITIAGGLVGLLVGGAFTRAISNLIQQPVILSPRIAVLGLMFAVIVGIVFGFYPAVKAARLNPIEALRYE
jgi:ABC-type antimicrobial peptide transport system permease subunit